ncbi:prolyl aminopeptidase [Salinisphaera sp. USBA-960]|uniref:prolyl aminopeptidase n=1 Tax=Salinisphaera orenii TaxID=856731 RepID=UPI000DBE63BF|nr:prolyl aminopeptidase [Salifodinibacter halophilus]NNC25856.1 prolyl aminopeptidase [Salifodinibacter halophilus]
MDSNAHSALFSVSEPFDDSRLAASDGHEIAYRQYGNPNGQPAIILHGGPGAGAGPNSPRFFDPVAYRIVVFDQRGCGRSTPHSTLASNTTWHLVDDIERLRRHLAIEQWLVFGGSWGSTLGLIYAETHPQRVTALILRGIFLLRRHEIAWFYQSGASALLPEAFEQYYEFIPPAERDDLVGAYYRRLTDSDYSVRVAAARRWTAWEAAATSLGQITNSDGPSDNFAVAFARIECHYFANAGFLESDDWILERVGRLRDIPATIVQGRLDLITPMRNAWALHRAWPAAELVVTPDAGHSAFDPSNVRALVHATERFKRQRAH